MQTMYLVVVSCCFAAKDHLCKTTLARLEHALRIAKDVRHNSGREGIATFFVVTGDVPYERSSATMAQLMKDYLVEHGAPSVIIGKGVGAFSEARHVTAMLAEHIRGRRNIDIVSTLIVSSRWYIGYARGNWERRARENKLPIGFAYVMDTAGWRTRLKYFVYCLVVRFFTTIGLEPWLENVVTRKQSQRLSGFTENGCR